MGANPIIYCLENLTDYFEFERLSTDLMALEGYPGIEPLGGSKDKGRDAINIHRGGKTTLFAYSVREDWKEKLSEDSEKIKNNSHVCDELVFVTTSKFSITERDEAISNIKNKYGWPLKLIGLEWLRSMLEGKHPEIIDNHPQIFNPHLIKNHSNIFDKHNKYYFNIYLPIGDKFFHWVSTFSRWRSQSKLDSIEKRSIARCLRRWIAIGISEENANKLFDNTTIGKPQKEIKLNGEIPIQIIVGDFGTGKSLIAERIFQKAVQKAKIDRKAPIPVFIEAKLIIGNLIETILNESNWLGNLQITGAMIIIDGMDEISISKAIQLLDEARELSTIWPNTTFFIFSRDIPLSDNKAEIIRIKLLDIQESIQLVSSIANYEINNIWEFPISIQNAINRPLFAILLGIYLQETRETGHSYTVGDLLTNLIEKSLEKSNIQYSEANEYLQKLALLSIDRGGGFVPISEIGPQVIIKSLPLSGLVIIQSTKFISFSLPILSQWFAAQIIKQGKINIEELLIDQGRLERWRYPLIILINISNFDEATKFLCPIAKANPGVANLIVNQAIPNGDSNETDLALPSENEIGNRIIGATQAWLSGLASLTPIIGPIRDDGRLKPLGLKINKSMLLAGWYHGNDKREDIISLPLDLFNQSGSFQNGWNKIRETRLGSHPAWAWKFSFDYLKNELSEILDNQSLLLENGFIQKELMWKTALNLIGVGDLHHSGIQINNIESKLNSVLSDNFTSQKRVLKSLENYIIYLKEIGKITFEPIWPGPDKNLTNGSWIWEPYSTSQLLDRTRAIYSAAMIEYPKLIEYWFPKFKSRFVTYVNFPAQLIGTISYLKNGSPFDGEPIFQWHLDPLNSGEKNMVNIIFLDDIQNKKNNNFDINKIYRKLRDMRQTESEWVEASIHHECLSIFGPDPVTEIVYDWLKNDLKKVKWYG